MTTTGMSVREMTESLTGYEENSVTTRFGDELGELPGTMTLRALVYIAGLREGQEDGAAYDAAMTVPLKGIMGAFVKDDDDDRDPMATVTSGKGNGRRTRPPGV